MTIVLRLRGGRAAADGPFYALLILSVGVVVGLLAFVWPYVGVLGEALALCRDAWMSTVSRTTSAGVLVPVGVIGLQISLVTFSLLRQWVATKRLLRRLRMKREPMPSRLQQISRRLGLAQRVDYIGDAAAYAFSYGLHRPRICISSGLVNLLDDVELEAVLRHERHHLESRDPLKIWLSRALATGLFFLPIGRELRDRYLVYKEIVADESSTSEGATDLPLARALLKLLSHQRQTWPEGLVAIGSFNVTQERIQRLISGQHVELALPGLKTVLLSLGIVVAIFLISYVPLMAHSIQPITQAECAPEVAVLYLGP